ncbi:MAG: DUF1801 domain-containing protein [Deferribacteres bacterium]|nr:DUF1801 domain-containing protein [candidate division KSB1 bacterium]MCB9512006.1 DUF1801 domain-containing protein [Deferribacteres bacterium]
MAELKTAQNEASVEVFLDSVEHEKRRQDCRTVVELMKEVTGEQPKMWGASLIGFGSYHYKYDSGREGDWFLTGCSPRKQSLSIYIMAGFRRYDELLGKLGKFKTGKSCLYVNKLEDIDLDVLRELIADSAEHIAKRYT